MVSSSHAGLQCVLWASDGCCSCFSRQPDCLAVVHAALAGVCKSQLMVPALLAVRSARICRPLMGCRYEAEERAQDVVFRLDSLPPPLQLLKKQVHRSHAFACVPVQGMHK